MIAQHQKSQQLNSFKSENGPEWFDPSVHMYKQFICWFSSFFLYIDIICLFAGKSTTNKCALWHTSVVWKKKTNEATNERGKTKNGYCCGVVFFRRKVFMFGRCAAQSSRISKEKRHSNSHPWSTRYMNANHSIVADAQNSFIKIRQIIFFFCWTLLLCVHPFLSTDANSNHGKKHDGQKLVEPYECTANEKAKKKKDSPKSRLLCITTHILQGQIVRQDTVHDGNTHPNRQKHLTFSVEGKKWSA